MNYKHFLAAGMPLPASPTCWESRGSRPSTSGRVSSQSLCYLQIRRHTPKPRAVSTSLRVFPLIVLEGPFSRTAGRQRQPACCQHAAHDAAAATAHGGYGTESGKAAELAAALAAFGLGGASAAGPPQHWPTDVQPRQLHDLEGYLDASLRPTPGARLPSR